MKDKLAVQGKSQRKEEKGSWLESMAERRSKTFVTRLVERNARQDGHLLPYSKKHGKRQDPRIQQGKQREDTEKEMQSWIQAT